MTDAHVHLISISRIHVHRGAEISLLRLRGTVASATQTDFEARVAEAGERSPSLLIDLSELRALSGEGVSALTERARLQAPRGGWLKLIAPPGSAARRTITSQAKEAVLGIAIVADPETALQGLSPRVA